MIADINAAAVKFTDDQLEQELSNDHGGQRSETLRSLSDTGDIRFSLRPCDRWRAH